MGIILLFYWLLAVILYGLYERHKGNKLQNHYREEFKKAKKQEEKYRKERIDRIRNFK